MGALSDNRNTPELSTAKQHPVEFTAINADILYAGSILAIDYTGEIQPAADTLGLRVIGRAPKKVDNTADGEKSNADHGVFRYANSGTSPVTRSLIGLPCYVADDQTVAANTTNLVPAGIVFDVDSAGVWVDQSVQALAVALKLVPPVIIAKTDSYEITAAQAFSRRCVFTVSKSSIATITLPSAVPGMLVGVKRLTAGAGYDVKIQAASGDTVLGSEAGKAVDNTVDAASSILWLTAADATAWIMAWAPADSESWVVNNA
jgi:hypothetical protein